MERIWKMLAAVSVVSFLTSSGSSKEESQLQSFTQMKGIVIGMHEVTNQPKSGDAGHITPKQLQGLILRIQKSGCKIVDMTTFINQNNPKNIVLSFDDGYLGNYTNELLFLIN